ncbi:MAG: transglycosylase SLT domain-containing protein [Gemmatimonadaceae bacterium]
MRAIALVLCAFPALASAQVRDTANRHVVIPAGAPSVRAESASVSSTDVSRSAQDVFGESVGATTPDSAAEPTWDMDVRSYATQDRVAHYVSMFTGRAKDRITERLERGTRYEPMIRAKFREGGVPEDMYYLALVESGFDPHAYSRAAAVGMWQFMTGTARDMGMRVDWWVDERRDPVKSTAAAVRFIRELRNQFGSLYLAAAAYNGGPGRIARGMTKFADDMEGTQTEDAFFVLAGKDYLKNETREYVPQLIAAALIAKEPTRYGMELHPRAAFAYDSVMVPASTPLAAVAKAAGVPLAAIADLNTHFLRGMTPPKDASQVRLPVGAAETFECAFAELPREDRVGTHTLESKKGDTIEGLARAAGVRASSLVGFNPKLQTLKSGRLAPGQPVLVPTAAVAAAALDIPDPSIEKYPGSTKRMKVHTVKRGESVGVIARKYGITNAQLMRLNGMKKPVIFPGQSLIVGGAARASVGKGAKAGKAKDGSVKETTSKKKITRAKSSKGKTSKSKTSGARKSGKRTKK